MIALHHFRWEIPNPGGMGGITAIDSYDVTGDGISDVVISRDDGNVEIYSITEVLVQGIVRRAQLR